MATEIEWAWAAGLFEGEGCFSENRVGGRSYLSLTVSLHQRDRTVLDRFHRIVEVGSINGPSKTGMMKWRTTGVLAMELAANPLFIDHLGNRRRSRLEEILGFVANNPPIKPGYENRRTGGRKAFKHWLVLQP